LSFIDSTKTKEAQAPTDTSQYSTPLMGSNSLPKQGKNKALQI